MLGSSRQVTKATFVPKRNLGTKRTAQRAGLTISTNGVFWPNSKRVCLHRLGHRQKLLRGSDHSSRPRLVQRAKCYRHKAISLTVSANSLRLGLCARQCKAHIRHLAAILSFRRLLTLYLLPTILMLRYWLSNVLSGLPTHWL